MSSSFWIDLSGCALPAAIDVPPEMVERAIEETRRRTAEAKEAAEQARQTVWRAAFRPHAIILTERTVPQPFFVAAFWHRPTVTHRFRPCIGPGAGPRERRLRLKPRAAPRSIKSGKSSGLRAPRIDELRAFKLAPLRRQRADTAFDNDAILYGACRCPCQRIRDIRRRLCPRLYGGARRAGRCFSESGSSGC